jgi:protein-tyrosine phosphatase
MSSDPTRIDITFDPTRARMEGVARHGNVPFDVPFISQITENLWTGGCANGLILPNNIDHLVSLYPWERYTIMHELKSELYVRLYDSLDQEMGEVESVAEWVLGCMHQGPTLVHCQAGLNRSSLVAARTLMLDGWSADRAIETLRDKRSPAVLCNPAFEDWLRERE